MSSRCSRSWILALPLAGLALALRGDVAQLRAAAQQAVQLAVHVVPGAHVRRLLLDPADLGDVGVPVEDDQQLCLGPRVELLDAYDGRGRAGGVTCVHELVPELAGGTTRSRSTVAGATPDRSSSTSRKSPLVRSSTGERDAATRR